mgnify:FL=1
MSDQRCGTCKWFDDHRTELPGLSLSKEYHQCLFPLPEWVGQFYTMPASGTKCPTYETKP